MSQHPTPDEFANPFDAPATRPSSAFKPADDPWADSPDEVDEATRRAYIQHEASVRAIGTLNYLGMFFLGLLGVGLVIVGILAITGEMAPPQQQGEAQLMGGVMIGMAVFFLAFAVLAYFVGSGLRKLQPWARWTQGVLASIQIPLSLIQLNPIGLLISGYFAYLMFCEKSSVVFSDDYKAIVARTPHIRPKTSVIVWVVLALLIGIIVAAIIAGVLMG